MIEQNSNFVIAATDVVETVDGTPFALRALRLHKVARVLDLLTGHEHFILRKQYGTLIEYQCTCDEWQPGAIKPIGCVHSVFYEQHIDEITQAPQRCAVSITMNYHRADWIANAAIVSLSVIGEEKASDL